MNAPSDRVTVAMEAPDNLSRIRSGLVELLQAHSYARDVNRSVWDFAVEIKTLHAFGLTNSDLRWLVCKGYVDHACELTLPCDDTRTFRPVGKLTLRRRTCFVLTETGAACAGEACRETSTLGREKEAGPVSDGNGEPDRGTDTASTDIPHWDSLRQEFCFRRVIVKRFKVPAENQEVILAAFEEEGWPPRIDDPLPPRVGLDTKRRLHDTINSLNRNQKHPLIHFSGDGTGEGVRWEAVSPDGPTECSSSKTACHETGAEIQQNASSRKGPS